MLHLCSFVDLVHMALLLLSSLLIHVGVRLQRHRVRLGLHLLVMVLEGRPVGGQVDSLLRG